MVRVQSTNMVPFSSIPFQISDLLLLGGPNPDPYPSTLGYWGVGFDLFVPIPGSGYGGFLFTVVVRYPTANHIMFTLVCHCPFLMYWPSLWSKTGETHSLTHSDNASQQCINDCGSCILGNLSGNWIQTFINEVKATFQRKRESDRLPAPFSKWASPERQQRLALHHC